MSRVRLALMVAAVVLALLSEGACAPGRSLSSEKQSPSIAPHNPFETRSDGATRLTVPPDGASDQNAAFSPDGTRLVFTRFDDGYNDGPASLFLLDLYSGLTTRLTPSEDQDNVNLPGAAWNAIVDRIVFASDRLASDDVWRIAPDGTDLTEITHHSGAPWFIEPSWSPDGQRIVFEADANLPDDRQQGSIWKVRADGTELTHLTDGPGGGTDDRQPNWSPLGDRILFQRRTPGSEDWNLFTMAPDGADLRQVTTAFDSDTDASWSPDGQRVVYSTDHGGLAAPSIFTVSAHGGVPLRATHDDTHEDSAPSWSPDGKWIAFESRIADDEDTPSSLWRIPVDDGGFSYALFIPLTIGLVCSALGRSVTPIPFASHAPSTRASIWTTALCACLLVPKCASDWRHLWGNPHR